MKVPVKEILLDANPFEKRLSVLEDGVLVEFHIERRKDRTITGNIYKGRVVNVLPGMQAAFVDVGLERTAFLHVTDVLETIDSLYEEFPKEIPRSQSPRIEKILKEGQDIIVQVEKEPVGTKGARLTSYITLPGRYLVLMPTYEKVGVSRKIEDERERKRLKNLVQRLKPSGYGFIIRTVCEGRRAEEIYSDMDYLVKLWESIKEKMASTEAPALLYEEPDLTLRAIRDMFTPNVKWFIIDSKEEYERAKAFTERFMPELASKVKLHTEDVPLFDTRGIEVELEKALSRTVYLPSGGYIVIDQMEALTAIDVNTGRYIGRRSSDETILRTNLEATREIVRQLKLRNIGGIIIIDFIDMARQADREKVYRTLREELGEDRARTNILKISELGIVEMTRKRIRESLQQSLLDKCPYCDGDGLVKRKDAVATEIYRELVRELPQKSGRVYLYVNPQIGELLQQKDGVIDEVRRRFKNKIVVVPVETFHREEYEIV